MMKDELSKEESSANPDRKAMEDASTTWSSSPPPARTGRPSLRRRQVPREQVLQENLPEVLYLQGEAYLKQNELDKALINS
ncbi:MAG: hypothetical protein ACLT8E_00490 [Akkermansia sp.]